MEWEVKKFTGLSVSELYDVLRLRAEVFVVEQDCVYQDLDGKDDKSLHVMGYEKNGLVAYARIVLPGTSYKEVSVGRVVVAKKTRGTSVGYQLMNKAIETVEQEMGVQPIRISAQSHLEVFYANLGFEPTGKSYLEDGIPHIEMLRAG